MRWACIVLPQLALDGVLRAQEIGDAPLAMITGGAQRRLLQAVNVPARQRGLRPGMTLTAAQALVRDFIRVEYDTLEIERSERLLAAWAYRFSSHVSLFYPRALLLEVESSLALFGPWPRFEARLRQELTDLGFRHRIVVAPNPVAARVLANVHDGLVVDEQSLLETLMPLSLERLGLPRDAARSCQRMGIRTLRQLLALPRAGLAKRFTAEVLLQLDRLLGQQPIALDYFLPPERFEQRLEFNFDVESNQALLFPLRRLCADLAAFLHGRDCGVERFVLHMEHRSAADSRLDVGLLSPERESERLFELARARLERLQIPSATQALRLVAEDLPVFVPERRELFDDRPQRSLVWQQLRERLRARLGEEAVLALHARDDHRPEHAWRLATENGSGSHASVAQRPGWLLPQAKQLKENEVRIVGGPERIESGWWDADDIRRDYFLIETRSGQQGWAYRAFGEAGPLMLQGWFA